MLLNIDICGNNNITYLILNSHNSSIINICRASTGNNFINIRKKYKRKFKLQ